MAGKPFWRLDLGHYVLFNCVSTLIALPVFDHDILPDEREAWAKLREQHFAEVRRAFASLQPHQRVIFFCHDPTALPFLARDEAIRPKLPQIERTIIRASPLEPAIARLSKLLSGLPVIRCCGHSICRMSTAVNQARQWKPFRVKLCPSLAGIELFNDGGFLTMELDAGASDPARIQFHALRR
ncbi:MAG: hypothetical protein MZW92_39955 [Comamonadaceae bacterium]|nr:hypothetical protein [Comamonadaceae bacterium]